MTNDSEEDRTGQKPYTPTLTDSQITDFKVRRIPVKLSFAQRFNKFREKDLTFILAGLTVLFMAPLAEHFILSPEAATPGSYKQGWGIKSSGRLSDGSSPYDPGVDSLAPGGVVGSNADLATGINSGGDSSLFAGSDPAVQSSASDVAPQANENTNADTKWKDAVASAAAKGAAKAIGTVRLPVPKPSLVKAAMAAAAGGGGGSSQWSPPPIGATHVPNAPVKRDSLPYVVQNPNFAGVGPRGLAGSAESADELKRAAADAGTAMNRASPAIGNAQQAAAFLVPSGHSAEAEGISSNKDSGNKDSKSTLPVNPKSDTKTQTPSLASLAAKANMEHAIDLDWKLKEKKAMMPLEIAEQGILAAVQGLCTGLVSSLFGVQPGAQNSGDQQAIPAP